MKSLPEASEKVLIDGNLTLFSLLLLPSCLECKPEAGGNAAIL